MRYLNVGTAICVACVLLFARPVNAQKHYSELTYPAISEVNVPEAQRVVLPNGLVLFLLEDHRLPIINMRARIGVGAIDEPVDKVGLAAITGAVMRSGGTTTMSGDEIDEELESIGASIETGINRTSGFARMTVLTENLDTALPILAEILRNPTFEDEKIDLQKVQARSSIARRNDDAQGIAGREFRKLIYGEESVFARHTEYETIEPITRDDLLAFHGRFVLPNNTMLGITGDFNADEMKADIVTAFGTWEKTGLNRVETPEVDYQYDSSIHYIEKNDINQSSIFLGHIGGVRSDSDYFALQVMNDILSGGFSGRLMKNVRSDQGLAYAVFGQFSANYDYPGIFYVGCMTRSETTVPAIRSMLKEVERMREENVTEEELALAKESFLNSFVFNFDTRDEVMDRQMVYEYYDYPRDFLQQTRAGIENVTRADIKRVARKHLNPDNVRILVVGRGEDFGTPLDSIGPVDRIDVAISAPDEEAPEASEMDVAKGRDLLNSAVAAAGGAAAFQAIRTVKETGRATVVTPQGEMVMEMTSQVSFPDKVRLEMRLPQGAMIQVMNGSDAWIISPMGTQPAPPGTRQNLSDNLWQGLEFLYGHTNMEGLQVQYLGSETVDQTDTEVILIAPPGAQPFKLYLDVESMLPVKRSARAMTPAGPTETDQLLSDFRTVNDVTLPFHTTVVSNGQRAGEASVEDIILNPDLPDDLFEVAP